MSRRVCVFYMSTIKLIKSQYARYINVIRMEALTRVKRNRDEDRISKIIDRVLRQIFGDEALVLIYKYLENKYSLKQNEISAKIDVFTRGLEEFLSSGAYVIEQKILEDIYSSYGLLRRLELERAREDWDFVSQVRFLREKYS
jgi:hypothetical protein